MENSVEMIILGTVASAVNGGSLPCESARGSSEHKQLQRFVYQRMCLNMFHSDENFTTQIVTLNGDQGINYGKTY